MNLLDKDLWSEVAVTIKGQKMRSILTMFGVFWGIFMLVVLVGCGFGMKKGLIGSIMGMSSNSIVYTPTTTSMAWNGFSADRPWHITGKDVEDIKLKMGRRLGYMTLGNLDGFREVGSGARSGYYQTAGVTPTYYIDIPQKVVYGRYLNETDVREHRKVCLAGERVVAELFDHPNPVGESLTVEGSVYKIVGVITHTNENISVGFFSQDCVLIPFTTEQDAFDHRDHIGMISVGLLDKYDINSAGDEIAGILKRNHNIHPEDKAAMEVYIVSFAPAKRVRGRAGP